MKKLILESVLALVIAMAVVVTGVLVVDIKHESRQRFAELQELKREADRLQIDWGRLQLEQSAWATHARIESQARDELGLVQPAMTQFKVVEQSR
jgi:cell division protein FtsL